MSNEIVRQTPDLTANVMEPKKKDDSRDAISQLDLLDALYLHEALVVDVSADHSDEYTVDVYDRGFIKPDGTPETPTRTGLIAHVLHSQDWFPKEPCSIGTRVLVHVLTDNTCWIKHPEEPILGVVVCHGCNGEKESSLPKNYYWVQFARIWNTNGSLPHQFAVYPAGSPAYNIVPAENLFERNCKTHHVRPGTVVVLKWNLDNQDPIPSRRYYFEVADEGTCAANPCTESSSSSSGSQCNKVCWFYWEITWDCVTRAFGVPHVVANGCYPRTPNPFNNDPTGVWIYDGPDATGTKCRFHYIDQTEKCCSDSAQCIDPTYPGDPPNPSRCCGSRSSGSVSSDCTSHCYYTWVVRWDCVAKAFYEPEVSVDCIPDEITDPFNEALDSWISRGQNADGECVYVYHQKTTQCCGSALNCSGAPVYPGDPPNPDQCCPGYKSSGASGDPGGGITTTPCNAIKDIKFECIGKDNVATIIYCDGTFVQKTWPCCCDNPVIDYRSGSSASHGVTDINCYQGFSFNFNCVTQEVSQVERYDSNCGDPIDSEGTTRPLNTWFKLNQVGDLCVLAYWVKSQTICDPDGNDCYSDPALESLRAAVQASASGMSVEQMQALCECQAKSVSSGFVGPYYYKLNICYSTTGYGTESTNEYIEGAAVPSLPYFGFDSSNNRCYCVPPGATRIIDPPPGSVIHSALATRTSCNCAASGSQSAPSSRTWQELRDCDTNLRSNKWIETTAKVVPNGIRIRDLDTGHCYYMLVIDPDAANEPANVITHWEFSADSCADCKKYWRATECGVYSPSIYYVTDTVKRFMEAHGELIFKLPDDVRCFRVDTTTSYTGLPAGGVLAVAAETFATCLACQSA